MTDTVNIATVDETLLSALKESVGNAFDSMVFIPITCGDVMPQSSDSPTGSISGTIGITGTINLTTEAISGSVSMVFSKACAEKIFRSMMMMGEDDPVDMTELQDAVGELANMVAGGAKSKLQGNGIDFVISLPTVAVGEAHRLVVPNGAVSFTVPVEAAGETFYMSASFQLRPGE